MSSTAANPNKVKLRLHYWNCRGRAQAVRYMLEDIAHTYENVDYQEDFESIDTIMTTWSDRKADRTVSGPFHSLPVLHWNETDTFAQTLTLAHLLAKKFNLYGTITPSIKDPILLEAYLNGVVSCAYTDVIVPALQAIWAMPDIENKDSFEYYPIRRLRDDLGSLNTLLEQSSTSFFYDQTGPTVADYFAFEAYAVARDIHPTFLPTNCEALTKLAQTMKERPALAQYFQNGRLLKCFTAAAHEEEYLKKLSNTK